MKQSHSSCFSHSVDTGFNKDLANSQLRFGIKLLKGQGCSQTFERSLSDAISIRDRLNEMGAWWQAQRLDNWIHRAQKQGSYLLSARRHEVPGPCLQAESLTPKQSEGGVSP